MADVFISYKSERRAAAEHLAEILADYGYSVWWDYGLVSGRDFGAQIEKELRAAKAVIVLWCSLSRESEWVLDEATVAKNLGTIVPATIERIDLPLGFGRAQTLDLSDWDGAPQSHKLDRLLRDIAARVGRPPSLNHEGLSRTERAWRRFGAPSLPSFALIAPLQRVPSSKIIESENKREAPIAPARAPSASVVKIGPPSVRVKLMVAAFTLAILSLGIVQYLEASASRRTEALWESTDASDPNALRAFLRTPGTGEYYDRAEAALQALEQERLLQARSTDTISALSNFLEDFPDTRHGLEVRGRIVELRSSSELAFLPPSVP